MQDIQSGLHHTTETPTGKPHYSLKQKFVFGVSIIILPVLGLLFVWLSMGLHRQAREETLEKARVVADQVILTRQWITDCMGGVFVHTASPGARDVQWATPDRIVTDQGTYQLFTPSMVTKKLSQYSFREKSYRFRLSSLRPLNRANRPDTFEEQALNRFNDPVFKESREQAYYTFTPDTLEYMVPLYQTRGCVKCHANELFMKGGVIGGLRITIPFSKMRQVVQKSILIMGTAGVGVTLAVILVLVFLINFLVLKPLTELEDKSRQLSSGNLNARVNLDTHDELERLGNGFNLMAGSLMRHRHDLEQKVAKATRDLARANHELLKLDKLKSDFLANMSHELRTPLTAVKGSTHYLERTVSDPDALSYIRIIEKNTDRLTRLIANLFDFTKLEAGKIDWEFDEADLALLMSEVLEILEPIAAEKEIRFQPEFSGPVTGIIDLERMEQVLVNLVENAVKFSRPGALIRAGVRDRYSHIEIFVQDQGPGIAQDHLDTIFEKFHTLPSPPDGGSKGTGMGLAICKAIVTAHQGEISVESREGEFSRFTITLPKEMPKGNEV